MPVLVLFSEIDMQPLGKRHPTKTDEFLEKFQTAFDPPPSSFSENYVADFLKHTLKIPPLYHFYAKKTLFKSPKFATKIFGLEMTPPPVRNFSENSSVFVGWGFPKRVNSRRNLKRLKLIAGKDEREKTK